jgi:Alpha amylase, catalytic domain
MAAGLRRAVLACALLLAGILGSARGEMMMQLFQVRWSDLTQKMPELAEAGYDSLWLPPPAKAGSVYSVGYDAFDAFDLGDQNQRGTIPTYYGTKAELLQMVQTAHRFGIRIYFDNVMNHRGFDVPGANASTPTNLYPGLIPQDFHLQTKGNYFVSWGSVDNWCDVFNIQNKNADGLMDLATEPGSVNVNFGNTFYSTIPKPVFVRQPGHPEYYPDTNQPTIGGGWRPFNGTNGQPVAEDVNAYLIRAVMWTLNETKCDGFRLDAVKHIPSGFFGNNAVSSPQTDDPSFSGYNGGIQAMYDYVHGYGNNVTRNGYIETDGNRNSCFDTETPRNDAVLFGEHAGAPPSFSEYINTGMRLLNVPMYGTMYGAMTGSSLAGMDQRDFTPGPSGSCTTYPSFTMPQSVMFAQAADSMFSYAPHRELQLPYYTFHEGLPEIYSDGYNQSGAPNYFPSHANANYLGENGDNSMPELCYLHNQLARGGTRSRWSDQNVVIYERYDYRDVSGGNAYTNADASVLLFAMNDLTTYPGDIWYDDGVARTSDGYYAASGVANSRGQGIVVGFPPGSVLSQLATSTSGANRTLPKLLVHQATQSATEAANTANNSDPTTRKIYVGGQTLAPGGGAVELMIPSDGWVAYGYQWPEPSRSSLKDAITLRQGGADAPRITVLRHDGANGDTNFSPIYPFKMRGSIDPYGNVVASGNYSNLTYAIDVPIVTNAAFDIIGRCDASAVNLLFKLDGGMDLNSQMNLGPTNNVAGVAPTNVLDLRDNKPGYASDVYLGYEQAGFLFRNGPEKFGARLISRDNTVSVGAETYYYTVGGNPTVVNGSGYGANTNTSTVNWVYHDPTATNNLGGANASATQRVPVVPNAGQAADVWVKVGYQNQANTGFIYYTTDGTNPEGSYGVGKGTTRTVQAFRVTGDSSDSTIDWWKGTIPAAANTAGAQIRYKVAFFSGGSVAGQSIQPISDADNSKLFGLSQFGVTNFNPTSVRVWLHNDLNPANTVTGLQEGYHILRARCFLPRTNKSAVYNTFSQTFYYDAGPPSAVFVAPPTNNYTITNTTYQVIVRADSSATELDYTITDSDPNNDDIVTHQNNGNGLSNGVPVFAAVYPATPTAALNTTYSNYPVEFRFNYVAVPTNGTAAITVHLKKATSALFPGRVTSLTNVVNTAAPSQFVQISDPASDGLNLILTSNSVYTIHTCFSSTLSGAANIDFFSIYINGVFQPRRDSFGSPLYSIDPSDTSCGTGLKRLAYDWTGAQPGTNVIQVLYTNNVILSATRTVEVAPPPAITGISVGTNNQYVTWSSYSNIYYQVWATTNLNYPLVPISTPIPGNSGSATFYDPSPDPSNKFYQIQVVQ